MGNNKYHIFDADGVYCYCLRDDIEGTIRAIEFESKLEALGFLSVLKHKSPNWDLSTIRIDNVYFQHDGEYIDGCEVLGLMNVEDSVEEVF